MIDRSWLTGVSALHRAKGEGGRLGGDKSRVSRTYSGEAMKVALAIAILLLAVLAGYHFRDRFVPEPTAHLSRVTSDYNAIGSALKGYRLNGGCYPSTEQGLEALVRRPETEPLPKKWIQVLKKVPLDPWDREFRYRLLPDGMDFEIYSVGPDGVSGTKDDASSLDE
jgi:general secretion pathway protein G